MSPRPLVVLKWAGAGMCAVILAAWFASGWFGSIVQTLEHERLWDFEVVGGRLCLARVDFGPPGSVSGSEFHSSVTKRKTPTPAWDWSISREVHVNPGLPNDYFIEVPLHVPLALIALVTGGLFGNDTRRRRTAGTNRCAKCGYDRAGLAEGAACPECGVAL